MSGFEKTLRANIRVNVNDNVTANVTLKVGASTQTVEVQAQAKGVDTEDAQTGQVVNRRFINDLPLIDRNVVESDFVGPRRHRDGRTVRTQSVPAPTSSPTGVADRLLTF